MDEFMELVKIAAEYGMTEDQMEDHLMHRGKRTNSSFINGPL